MQWKNLRDQKVELKKKDMENRIKQNRDLYKRKQSKETDRMLHNYKGVVTGYD